LENLFAQPKLRKFEIDLRHFRKQPYLFQKGQCHRAERCRVDEWK
jgi:hypothetical protein